MKCKPKDVPVMPTDQLLEGLTVATLRLFDEELFVLGFVNSMCSPFQDSFHGHERLDARVFKR
jgi:hypothetical protein